MPTLPFTHFIESIDSVRFVGRGREERMAHAEIELGLALLLGQRIVVPSSYGFDSLGFLTVASRYLDARDRGRVLPRHDIARPFVLAHPPNQPQLHLVAAEALARPDFITSAWRDIGADGRLALAGFLRRSDFVGARRTFPAISARIAQLEQLSRYFVEGGAGIQREQPAFSLPELLRAPFTAESAPRSEAVIGEQFQAVRAALGEVERAAGGVPDRSSVRRLAPDVCEPDVAECLIEFVDSCYNAVVHDSCRAEGAQYSTPLDDAPRAAMDRGQALAALAVEQASASHAVVDSTPHRLMLRGPTRPGATPIGLAPDEVWSLLATTEWVSSVETLHRALLAARRRGTAAPPPGLRRFPDRTAVTFAAHVACVSEGIARLQLSAEEDGMLRAAYGVAGNFGWDLALQNVPGLGALGSGESLLGMLGGAVVSFGASQFVEQVLGTGERLLRAWGIGQYLRRRAVLVSPSPGNS